MTVKEYNRSVEEFADSVYVSSGIIILLSAIIINGFCLKLSAYTQAGEEQGTATNKNESTKGTPSRVGYGNIQLYGTYYVTPLFRTGKGPGGNDLYPFEISVAFNFND